MAVDALLGLGTRLYYSTDGSTYTELTDMDEIGSPGSPEVEQVEATPMNPTSRAREFLWGLVNYGTFSCKQFWNKTRYTTLKNRLYTATYWRFVFPDNATPTSASKEEFIATPVKVQVDPPQRNKALTISVEAKLTGASTYTAQA